VACIKSEAAKIRDDSPITCDELLGLLSKSRAFVAAVVVFLTWVDVVVVFEFVDLV